MAQPDLMELNARERHLIEHSLGLDRSRWPYRNYFAAGDGHADRPVLDALVERGLMLFQQRDPGDSLDCYRVTHAGSALVGHALPPNIIDS